MNNMQFAEDDQNEFGRPPELKKGGGMTDMLIRWGLVSSRQEAQYVLIGVTVIALVLAYFLYGYLSGGAEVPTTPVYGTGQTI